MAHENRMTFRALAGVKPSIVVRLAVSGVQDFGVGPCNATQVPFGIAQNWTEGAPGTPFDTGLAASTQVRFMVWGPGSVAVAAVKKEVGAEYAGILVGADVNSELVFVSTGWAVGYLLEGGVDGQHTRHRVFVHPVFLGAAQ